MADGFWIYEGCDDGRVCDLSSKMPFADIFWLDVHAGVLNVSDRDGGLTVIDHEDELQWSRNSAGDNAWMVRADDHGHSQGVTAYAADGAGQLWHTGTNGNVLFGWQEQDAVYAGTGRRVVQRLAKSSGAVEASYLCDAAVYSCAMSVGGRVWVHVVSDGHEPGLNVQFQRAIREPGARYVVDALHSSTGGFHRVRGEVRCLV